MFLRMIYDDKLAQAAYLIGCQRTGDAILIDPERDVDRYIQAAAAANLRIAAVAETHIHADFLSGARELAQRTGARVYLSAEGGPDWTYQWPAQPGPGEKPYDHRPLKDGDTFSIGNIEFKALHTPGHTPEHISFLVTDKGGGASEPMGIITGDFVFVGDVGRPDLLETAAGQAGAKDPAARALFRSLRRFTDLPDYLQVWPAHGAGSACGKALGAVPQTTVGYERRFNEAIQAAAAERTFVDFVLSGQPEPPLYFARMKRLNRDGPPLLGELPRPRELSQRELAALDGHTAAIIDARPWRQFRAGHIAAALNIPQDSMFPTVAGSYIEPGEEIYLVADPPRVEAIVRDLVRIGLDNIAGWAAPQALEACFAAGGRAATIPEVDVGAARDLLASGGVSLDVRRADEFAAGHIPGARHIAYPRLPERLEELPRGKRLVVNCRSGVRSARASAYLRRKGFDPVNVAGGFLAWQESGGPVQNA